MKLALFYHSLISDWNHGNAHFLRGTVRELLRRGHEVRVFEPQGNWSTENLLADHGSQALAGFFVAYPELRSQTYDLETLDLEEALDGVDLILAHEWNSPELIRRLGKYRARHRSCRLLFHDTHHRAVTQPEQMAAYDLREFDGVLAFGNALRDVYLDKQWAKRVWTWHEAADVRLFRPMEAERRGDLVWVGNWGDEERSKELHDCLIDPIVDLKLRAAIHGVRYPETVCTELADKGIAYYGWAPNHKVPRIFAAYGLTVHIPRRPYAQRLPGIPTIRVFEALACGIPLVSAYWHDAEHLFREGRDYLPARNGREMREHIRLVLNDRNLAEKLSAQGRQTILKRHSCAHRVNELLHIAEDLGLGTKIGEVA